MSAAASLAPAFDHASDEAPVEGAAALARAAEHRARRVRLALGGLSVALLATCVISVGVGAVRVPPSAVLAALAGALGLDVAGGTAQQEAVLLAIRVPRVLLGVLVGAGLAVSGALMQGLFRNPLADPGLVGVSSGAALGAATAIVLASTVGVTALALGSALVAVAAFGGGLATTAVVYRIATRGGRTSVATMLLAGIAVNALTAGGNGSEPRTLGPSTLEVAILDVNRPRRAFRRITGSALEALLPEAVPESDGAEN